MRQKAFNRREHEAKPQRTKEQREAPKLFFFATLAAFLSELCESKTWDLDLRLSRNGTGVSSALAAAPWA
jgi:hypothetical protein